MCHDWESNWRPSGSWAGNQSTEPHQPGFFFIVFKFVYLSQQDIRKHKHLQMASEYHHQFGQYHKNFSVRVSLGAVAGARMLHLHNVLKHSHDFPQSVGNPSQFMGEVLHSLPSGRGQLARSAFHSKEVQTQDSRVYEGVRIPDSSYQGADSISSKSREWNPNVL